MSNREKIDNFISRVKGRSSIEIIGLFVSEREQLLEGITPSEEKELIEGILSDMSEKDRDRVYKFIKFLNENNN